MPLNKKGKKIKRAMTKQYGKKKGEKVFYAMENSGKLKKVIKAVSGRDAGMGMGGKTGNYGGGSKSSSNGGKGRDLDFQQRGMSKADYAKSKQTQNFGGRDTKSKIGPPVKDVPFKPPLSTAQSLAVGLVVPFLGTGINFAAKQQYKSRQKFAKKEGLYRDVYKTTGKVLQPNAPIGKDYLKAAGFGKPKTNIFTSNGGDDKGPNKPIIPTPVIPVSTTKPVDENLVKPKDNFFNFVAYKVGGLSGGVSYGPPPKKGPNSQVPPVKMKKGGYKK